MLKATCNCGAVKFEINGDILGSSFCHCGQCRRQSGNYWASANLRPSDLKITRQDGLKWFASSEFAKRGFCAECGSNLFWKHNDEDQISVSLGAFELPTGVSVQKHIFVADKGDYYVISDDLPQHQ